MSSRRDLSSLHSTTQLSSLPRCGTVTVCAINNKCPVAITVLRPSLCLDYSFPLFFHVLCSLRHENRDPGASCIITAPDPDRRPRTRTSHPCNEHLRHEYPGGLRRPIPADTPKCRLGHPTVDNHVPSRLPHHHRLRATPVAGTRRHTLS